MPKTITEAYGRKWPGTPHPLEIEFACIRERIGDPFEHYWAMRHILWPELDDHRWALLCGKTIVDNKITTLMGAGSTGKSHSAAWFAVCYWFVDPQNTCVLVSSTTMDKLKLVIWGEIVNLWQRAINRFDWLPGHVLDSRVAITYQSLTDDEIDDRSTRDMRMAIKGVPCIQGGKFVGLGKFVGIKHKRLLLCADECAFMGSSFLSACSNLDKNPEFRAIFMGNPNDILDPLGKAAEPIDGWTGHIEPEKTSTWKTRFMDGVCVNLVGTDTPNNDEPGLVSKYPYLIKPTDIERTRRSFGAQSFEFYSQCKGVMRISQLSRRVLSRDMCVKFGAMDPVTWDTGETVKIAALDAAYGGDRCVGGHIEFGNEVGGKTVLFVHPPVIVPIALTPGDLEEDQIARWAKQYCEDKGIPPENFFHDSTGRGSLGTALSAVWGVCNPVEFGGSPTKRPVGESFMILDRQTGQLRPKRCDEHYSKFVTELWFAVRYAIEAGQMRGLPEDVMEEGCMRQWERVRDDKIEVESKSGTPQKPGMKQRVGRSPDLMDWLSIGVEGARRRGFQIGSLSNKETTSHAWDWMEREQEKYDKLEGSYRLLETT